MSAYAENYDRPGDLFPRCDECSSLYGCMARECESCATTNLCHSCYRRAS